MIFHRRYDGLDFGRSRRRRKPDKEMIRKKAGWVFRIAAVAAFAFFLVFFFGYRITISGSSMKKVLQEGDQMLVNRLVYEISVPKEGDVIVFAPNGTGRSRYSVKRVIAGPTDTVQVKDGYLYVNGKKYQKDGTDVAVDNPGAAEEKIKVGADEYFVLGDNLSGSEDSRFSNIGNINKSEIVGKAWLIIRPFSRIGRVQ